MRNLLAILSLIFAAASIGLAKIGEAPFHFAVVKTWRDLEAQTAVVVEGQMTVRLGVSSNKVPRWSAVMFYCLTENYSPNDGGSSADSLGPVAVTVEFGNEKSERPKVQSIQAKEDWPEGQYLYTRAIPGNRTGSYRIVVRDRKGTVLADADVAVTKDFFHPWSPWLVGTGDFKMPGAGSALPRGGGVGILVPPLGNSGALPPLLPVEEKATLEIENDRGAIVVKSEKPFTTSHPERHFLARWWVNDKPFVPDRLENFPLFEGYGKVTSGKELRVKATLARESLKAKPGDKIALQLLHSASGFAWCDDFHLEMGISAREDIRLSNKIELAGGN